MPIWQQTPAPGRYGALLLLLVASYLLSAFFTGRWVEALQVVVFTAAALLALRSSPVPRRAVRLLLIIAFVAVPVFFALSLSTATGDVGTGVANIWTGVVLLAAVAMIVRRVLGLRTVTMHSIYRARSPCPLIGPL